MEVNIAAAADIVVVILATIGYIQYKTNKLYFEKEMMLRLLLLMLFLLFN